MLGLFDSGLGGLTVLRRLREELPDADVLYFADHAHSPYGDRSVENLTALLRSNVAWLDERGVDAIVMACNTSCSVASAYGWPPARARIFDLIEAAAEAVAQRALRHVAVIATTATVRSGAYARAIAECVAGADVAEIAAPALVPLIESASTSPERLDAAVAAVCAQVPASIEALVYGCTHYPLLDASFARILGADVMRIDPALVQAQRVARVARAEGFADGSASTRYVTTGDLESFRERLTALTGTNPASLSSSRA
ncbi:MAG TPA: glutamate racemase [Candidatus Tyrphobacter sp.]